MEIDINKQSIFDNKTTKDNISQLIKINKFTLINGDIELPTKIILIKHTENKKGSYYAIISDTPKRENYLFPFKINLNDKTYESCYIANVHKTPIYTGTQIVSTILKFLKTLGFKKTSLMDGASIECAQNKTSLDISLFKLIEKGMTFYQKFGFVMEMNENHERLKEYFDNTDNINKYVHIYLNNFKKIKIVTLHKIYTKLLHLLAKVIEKQDYDNLEIYIYHSIEPYLKKRDEYESYVVNTISDINKFLSLFTKTDSVYLYELMIDLFYNKCDDYSFIQDMIMLNQIYKIKYHNKQLIFPDVALYDKLNMIRYSAKYVKYL
jgi:hypothetical protein